MTRHASTDQLASLAVGELRHRKAVRISAHMAACARCTQISEDLTEVPAVLAATPYPPLPDTVSVRIEAAFRIELNQRLSAAPATEAGRRELSARSRRRRADIGPGGWHLPGLSVPATRLIAAAGAVVVVGGGGYLVASNLPSAPGTSSSSSAAVPAPTQPMRLGPAITYGSSGSQHRIDSVSSVTNFVPAQLRSQALGAVREAQLRGVPGIPSSHSANASTGLTPSHSNAASGAAAGTRLSGCISAVGPGRTVLLVDVARYEGKPATIIVFGSTTTSQAEVVVAADTCSATSPDVLARAPLGHL